MADKKTGKSTASHKKAVKEFQKEGNPDFQKSGGSDFQPRASDVFQEKTRVSQKPGTSKSHTKKEYGETFGQNVQKFYISSFGLFVQKFPATIRITSATILIILKINTIPPIKPPAIQFKAKTPMLPLIPKFFGMSQRHILRIPNGHPAKIQYKNQSKPSVLLHIR